MALKSDISVSDVTTLDREQKGGKVEYFHFWRVSMRVFDQDNTRLCHAHDKDYSEAPCSCYSCVGLVRL